MFEPTAGRLQLDINSLLVNIYIGPPTYRQLCWERGNIHCVRPFGANAHNSSDPLAFAIVNPVVNLFHIHYAASEQINKTLLQRCNNV